MSTPEPPPAPEGALIRQARQAIPLTLREVTEDTGIGGRIWGAVERGYRGGQEPFTADAALLAYMARKVGVTPEQLDQAGRPDAGTHLRNLTAEPPPSSSCAR
jgi:hypothetical protein